MSIDIALKAANLTLIFTALNGKYQMTDRTAEHYTDPSILDLPDTWGRLNEWWNNAESFVLYDAAQNHHAAFMVTMSEELFFLAKIMDAKNDR